MTRDLDVIGRLERSPALPSQTGKAGSLQVTFGMPKELGGKGKLTVKLPQTFR